MYGYCTNITRNLQGIAEESAVSFFVPQSRESGNCFLLFRKHQAQEPICKPRHRIGKRLRQNPKQSKKWDTARMKPPIISGWQKIPKRYTDRAQALHSRFSFKGADVPETTRSRHRGWKQGFLTIRFSEKLVVTLFCFSERVKINLSVLQKRNSQIEITNLSVFQKSIYISTMTL